MKRYFWTGVILFLPLVLTLMILIYAINLLTNPFTGLVELVLLKFPFKDSSLRHLLQPDSLVMISKMIILLLFSLLLLAVGFFVQHFFGYYLFDLSDKIFYKIPIVNRIYGLFQETIFTLFSTNPKNFKVVLAKFPQSDCYGIGVLTKEQSGEMTHATVLMSGANPTISFPLVIESKDLIPVDANAEAVLKFVLSYGMINKAFKVETVEAD